MKQEISKATLKALEKIAMQESAAIEGRGGLERKWNDTEDFPEVAYGQSRRCSLRRTNWANRRRRPISNKIASIWHNRSGNRAVFRVLERRMNGII